MNTLALEYIVTLSDFYPDSGTVSTISFLTYLFKGGKILLLILHYPLITILTMVFEDLRKHTCLELCLKSFVL